MVLFTMASILIFCTFGNIVVATVCLVHSSSFLKRNRVQFSFPDTQNDIADVATLNIKWYLMGIKEQKMYGYLLVHVQHPCVLTIGGVYPLNWPTCVQVISFYLKLKIQICIRITNNCLISAFQSDLLLH